MSNYNPNSLIQDLASQNYAGLVSKYNPEKLLSDIFERDPDNGHALIDDLKLQRFAFAYDFVPKDRKVTIKDETKKRVLALVVNLKTQDINELKAQLQQIDPNLTLPPDFNLQNAQAEANQILKTFENINLLLIGQLSYNYLGDTLNLVKMPIEQIKSLRAQADALVQKINEEYRQIADYETFLLYEMPPALAAQVTDFLRQIGRTNLFAIEEKKQADIEQLLQILIKFGVAADIALQIKPRGNDVQIDEKICSEEIKKYLTTKISI